MKHEMKLQSQPFERIKSGLKTIEMRLFDEKRQTLRPGDEIVFTNLANGDVLPVKILSLHIFPSFKELYLYFDKKSLGYEENEVASFSDMEKYYSKDEQSRYGVVGIEILKKN